jgi:hypothetical protein
MKQFILIVLVALSFGCAQSRPHTKTVQPERSNYTIYDTQYRPTYRVQCYGQDCRVYDSQYRLRYYIEDGRVYDENWNPKARIE